MKRTLPVVLLVSILTGCAFGDGLMQMQKSSIDSIISPAVTDMATPVPGATYAPTDPERAELFFAGKPGKKYKVIGDVVVSTDNRWGMNKPEADVRKAMQEKAASIGGDGVVEIKRNLNTLSGQVIRYSKR